MKWQTVIGLEVHTQLMTKSKIFSGAPTSYGAAANHQACEIDLALPGVLPVLNQAVLTMAIKFGLAINATIAKHSIFARKHYFYPDLPKGYQISQYEQPIVSQGYLDIELENNNKKRITIRRAHLEEDAGKSVHEDLHGMTGVDLNRAGIPLLEIVSDPVIDSAAEAVLYLKTLHTLVRYLGICDGIMQQGSFRCDANVSVKPEHSDQLGTRTEIKNLNSFRFLERAINYEVLRQIDLLEDGKKVIQETRLYDAESDSTRPMRSKEEAQDYRYFPDPDLLPIIILDETIEAIRQTLPELPQQKLQRFCEQYELSVDDANQLISDVELAVFFERVVEKSQTSAKVAANWILGELLAALNKENKVIQDSSISAESLADLLNRIHDNTISGKIAKKVFATMWQEKISADEVIEKEGLKQITDQSSIENVIKDVLAKNPDQVAAFRGGKEKVFGFFVGQVMQIMQGKANPQQVNELLKHYLKSSED